MNRFIIFCVVFFFALSNSYPCKRVRHLVLVGDGSAANVMDVDGSERRGWGQVLPTFLKNRIEVKNFSSDSVSARKLMCDSVWKKILSSLRYNDFLLIQLGHNDMAVNDSSVYSDMNELESSLTKMVGEALDKRVRVILVTPTPQYSFSAHGYYNSLGAYPQAIRRVAQYMQVPCIDLDKFIAENKDNSEFQSLFSGYFVNEKDVVLSKQASNVRAYLNERGAIAIAEQVATSMKKISHIRRYVSLSDTVPNVVYTIPYVL